MRGSLRGGSSGGSIGELLILVLGVVIVAADVQVVALVRPTSFRTGVIFFLRIPRLKYFFINHIFKTI